MIIGARAASKVEGQQRSEAIGGAMSMEARKLGLRPRPSMGRHRCAPPAEADAPRLVGRRVGQRRLGGHAHALGDLVTQARLVGG